MNLADRNARIRALFDECANLLERKGKDYGPNGSAFENFDAIATLTGTTREAVLWTLLSKHLVTIRGGKSATEPMRQRILDAIAYLAILEAMLSGEAATADFRMASEPRAVRHFRDPDFLTIACGAVNPNSWTKDAADVVTCEACLAAMRLAPPRVTVFKP